MPKRAYRPSGLSEAGAGGGLLLKSVATGVVVGAIEAFVGQWFSLFLLFPLLVGGVVGAVAAAHVTSHKVRAPLVALALAFVGGAVGQATVHVGEYALFRGKAKDALREELRGAGDEPADEQLDALIDGHLEARTGHAGLVGFLHLDAETGTEVKKVGQSKGLEFSGLGSWILWLVELLLAAGVAGWMAFDEARKPFCEVCKHWYDMSTDLAVGSGAKADVKALRAALLQGEWDSVPSLLGAPTAKEASTLVLEGCSTCAEHERRLTFTRHVGLDAKPQADVKLRTMLTGDELRSLSSAIEKAKPAPPPTTDPA